jgi:hypothetical protein
MPVVINDVDFEVLDAGRGEQHEPERPQRTAGPARDLRSEDIERGLILRRERQARVMAD